MRTQSEPTTISMTEPEHGLHRDNNIDQSSSQEGRDIEKCGEPSEDHVNGCASIPTVSKDEETLAGETSNSSHLVDWESENDPDNPLNWSSTKKAIAIGIVSFITFLSPLASTIIAPGTKSLMEDFNTTNSTLGSFVTSVYLLGYVFGPLLVAPLSELYGRAILYNTCNVLFLIFNIACAVAPNMGSLITFRFFAGMAGSCPVTLGAGSIADMIPLERRGLAMSFWVLGPLVGPVVGPIAGGYLCQAAGWRWLFWLLAIVGGVICIVTFVGVQESSAYVILQRKAKRLQKDTGNTELRSKLDFAGKPPRELFTFSIVRPLKMLIFSPIVFLLSLYMATLYGYMYLCFTTFPRIFEEQYDFSEASSGLAYIGMGVGSIVGLGVAGGLSDPIVRRLTAKNNGGGDGGSGGKAKPEYRLPTMMVGAILVPVGLFWYGWAAEAKTQYMLPIVGTGFLGAGMVIAIMASSTYLVDAFTVYAASAMAAATVFRSLLGALLPLAGPAMFDHLGVGWGNSVLAFISIAMLPLPFVFFKYGEKIREGAKVRL